MYELPQMRDAHGQVSGGAMRDGRCGEARLPALPGHLFGNSGQLAGQSQWLGRRLGAVRE